MSSVTITHEAPLGTADNSPSRHRGLSRLGFLLACLGAIALVLMVCAPLLLVPAEDATILFQYSDNLATTGTISYNAHGPRVEGATDFLWMALLAGLRTLHVPAFWATAAINGLCAVLIAAGLLFMHRQLTGGVRLRPFPMLLAVIGGLLLAPPMGAALAGFSVLPFTLLILSASISFLLSSDTALALISLLLCLVRPDGIVFAAPLICFRLFASKSGAVKRVLIYTALFALPGAVYFVWRWRYFGQFLPLPFLVKSDTHRVLGIAVADSNVDLLKYLAFNAILLPLALGRRLRSGNTLKLLLSVGVVPTMFYLTMRLDQNIADRFFMYLLLCPAMLIALNWRNLNLTRVRLGWLGAALWVLLLSHSWFTWMSRFLSDGYRNNVVAIARELGAEPSKGTLALSEAGRIAYYSGWQTTDMWGLNTPEFAHHLLQPADIQGLQPDIVVLYFPEQHDDCRPDPAWQTPYAERTWPHLAANVITGLGASGGYQLMMVPSSGYLRRALHHFAPGAGEYQCWFVKRLSPEHDDVIKILQRHGAVPDVDFVRIRSIGGLERRTQNSEK